MHLVENTSYFGVALKAELHCQKRFILFCICYEIIFYTFLVYWYFFFREVFVVVLLWCNVFEQRDVFISGLNRCTKRKMCWFSCFCLQTNMAWC